MNLHKIGIKFLAQDADALNLVELIPVFHRWIQTAAVEDLLFDVADYSHVPSGPGVMIIAHEGDYAFDESGGRRGFLYYSKHELQGDLDARLATVARKALKACKRMSAEQGLGPVSFPGNALEIFSNDRLVAPNTDEAYEAFEPALRRLLDKLYGGAYEIEREADPRERLTLRIRAREGADVDTLLERLEA
jgi:hypothetical protein